MSSESNLNEIISKVSDAIIPFIKLNQLKIHSLDNSTVTSTKAFEIYALKLNETIQASSAVLSSPYSTYLPCMKSNRDLFNVVSNWKRQYLMQGQNNISQFSSFVIDQDYNTYTSFDSCYNSSAPFEYKLPSYLNSSMMNILKLSKMNNTDMFNEESIIATDLCVPFVINSRDTTLDLRTKIFSLVIKCNDPCSYKEVDDAGFVTCTCPKYTQEISTYYIPRQLKQSYQSSILSCTTKTFNQTDIIANIGFWVFITFNALIVLICLSMFYYLSHKYRLNYISRFKYYDSMAQNLTDKNVPTPVGAGNEKLKILDEGKEEQNEISFTQKIHLDYQSSGSQQFNNDEKVVIRNNLVTDSKAIINILASTQRNLKEVNYINNDYIENYHATLKDYFNPENIASENQLSFSFLFFEYLKASHTLLKVFFKRSQSSPIELQFISAIFYYSLLFHFNCILLKERLIEGLFSENFDVSQPSLVLSYAFRLPQLYLISVLICQVIMYTIKILYASDKNIFRIHSESNSEGKTALSKK